MTKDQRKPAPERVALSSLKKALSDLTARVETVVQEQHSHPRATDIETSVAGRCSAALDELQKVGSSRGNDGYAYNSVALRGSNGYDYAPGYIAPTGPVPRVIDYLRQRYGIPDPAGEAQRLSADLDRAQRRIFELEQRLEAIRGATA